MLLNNSRIFAIKEKIQDLEDEKNRLITEALKSYGWDYSNVLNAQNWMWSKTITTHGREREVYMTQDKAWSYQLFLSLNEELPKGNNR
jgi:hypothetical protein